jgi:hypothetical protein
MLGEPKNACCPSTAAHAYQQGKPDDDVKYYQTR